MGIKVIKPLGTTFTAIREKRESVTKSGIVLPESSVETKRTKATVVSVGNGVQSDGKQIEIPYKVGDTVIVGPYSGVPMEAEGYKENELYLFSHNDVFALEQDADTLTEEEKGRVSVPNL